MLIKQVCPCCRPEFLNRIDEIIVFRQLTKGEVKMIADIMLNEVFARATEKGIKIDVTERFKVGCSCPMTLSAPVLISLGPVLLVAVILGEGCNIQSALLSAVL